MSTLSIDGHVYISDALDRRELVRLAPAATVDMVLTRIRTVIEVDGSHTISEIADLPGSKATALLLSVSSGAILVTLTDNSAGETQGSIEVLVTGTMIMVNADGFSEIELAQSGTEEAVYDLIIGGIVEES